MPGEGGGGGKKCQYIFHTTDLIVPALPCPGLDSQFAIVETVVTGLQDAFPRQLRPSGAGGKRPWMRKTLLVVSVCTGGFVVGIPFTCKVRSDTDAGATR